MHCKHQIFTDEVFLQCVFDKYVITYQNILGEDMVRPHLVESSYYMSNLNHFLNKKKKIYNSCCYTKKNFKDTETCKYF